VHKREELIAAARSAGLVLIPAVVAAPAWATGRLLVARRVVRRRWVDYSQPVNPAKAEIWDN